MIVKSICDLVQTSTVLFLNFNFERVDNLTHFLATSETTVSFVVGIVVLRLVAETNAFNLGKRRELCASFFVLLL